jgi:uncharacterized MAPEG superfamily protein
MAFEYKMLVLMTVFLLLAFIPSSLAKLKTFGGAWIASNRDPLPGTELPAWGARSERAHANLKDNLPGFIVAVLLLGIVSKFDHMTAWATGLYVVGRVSHYFSYIAGNVRIRFLGYILALSTNLFLLAKVFL